MTPTLDLLVSQVVYRANLMEKLVHDPGPWYVAWGPFSVGADRLLSENGVTISGYFHPAFRLLGPQDLTVRLLCNDVELASRDINLDPDGKGFTVQWEFEAIDA